MCRRPVLALTVSAAVIAACGTEQSAPSSDLECAAGSGSLVVVAAVRQNSPRPRVEGPVWDVIAGTVGDGRSVVFIDADVSPTVRAKFVPETLPANERARRERVDADIVEVSAQLSTLRADAGEVDVTGALTVAARAARTGSGTPTVLLPIS